LSKIVLIKGTSAIFLVTVLLAGIFGIGILSSPLLTAYGQTYQNAKCDNTNVNINGIGQTQIQTQDTTDNVLDENTGLTGQQQELSPEEELEALNTLIGNGNGEPLLNIDRNIVNLCINDNDNELVGIFTGTQSQSQKPIEPCVICFLNADIVDEIELTLQLPGFIILELPAGVDLVIGADVLTIEQLCRLLEDHTPQLTVDQLPLLLDVLGVDVGVDLSQEDFEILEQCLIDAGIIIEEDNLV
jgi:hypothetical protein